MLEMCLTVTCALQRADMSRSRLPHERVTWWGEVHYRAQA
jgi:hypothetical protein